MPNTLVHVTVQSVSTKALWREADFKWIALGCLVPDVPWIVQRVVLFSGIGVNRFDLVQYATVQASFFFSLLLCAALALAAADFRRIFLLLAGNSFLHLLLDAAQIKWANGVHFLAPVCWEYTNFGLIWPEHPLILALTAAGAVILVVLGMRDRRKTVVLTGAPGRYAAAVLLLLSYLALPVWLRAGPELADNHYIATLRDRDARPGRYVELDRSRFHAADATAELFSGERVKLKGPRPDRDTLVSIRGFFADPTTIRVTEFHVHSRMRDLSSQVAVAGIAFLWLAALAGGKIIIGNRE
ncbi:MAG: hypothetical protein Kow0089_24590 [Desulfobulbaceae bacterium]